MRGDGVAGPTGCEGRRGGWTLTQSQGSSPASTELPWSRSNQKASAGRTSSLRSLRHAVRRARP